LKIKKLKTNKIISDFYEKDVIKADADHYDKSAKSYDEIVINNKSHNRLRKSLEYSISHLSKFKSDIKALDACGGTGNASFILNEIGCDNHLVDLLESIIDNFKIFCKYKYFNLFIKA
jgi:ubiquinone/menaquinone biosynthesis C-methylase UbiE